MGARLKWGLAVSNHLDVNMTARPESDRQKRGIGHLQIDDCRHDVNVDNQPRPCALLARGGGMKYVMKEDV